MTLASRLGVGLTLTLLLAFPQIVWSQSDRESGSSTGRRHLIEQAERDRQQRQRWDADEQEFRRRSKARQRQREEYMQLRRQDETTTQPVDPAAVP